MATVVARAFKLLCVSASITFVDSKIKAQFCSESVPLSTAPVYRTQQTQLTGVAVALLQKTIVSALSDQVCLELALIMQLLFMWEYCITCEIIKCFIKCVPCEQVDALRTSSDIFLSVFSLPLCQPYVKPKFFYKYNSPTFYLCVTKNNAAAWFCSNFECCVSSQDEAY